MLGKFEFAADLETPVSAYLKLSPLNPVFLLESVERNETIGRYSFIGILPQTYFVLEEPHSISSLFRSLQDALPQRNEEPLERLQSGVIGFVSYNAAALLHPKLRFRSSEFPLAGFVLAGATLIFDHLKRRLLLSSILPEQEQQSLMKEIRTCLQTSPPVPRHGVSSEPSSKLMPAGSFREAVEKARAYISAGDIYQVVLSMQFEGETSAHPFQMYRALRMINPSPYMFYFDFQNRFQFFGSSPETLVRTERSVQGSGSKVLLRPIAGTRPRGSSHEHDLQLERELLHDEKEKAEHLMLLDLARNDLGRIAQTGSVKVTEFMKVERYSHVMHLVSTVESHVNRQLPLIDLFSAVFPAGTVTGAPKIRAMQIIDELEPHSRGLYAGSLGYLSSNGEVDHCIAIRCLQVIGNRYLYTAGAGIVADSKPENEYQEAINKTMALRTMLRVAEEPL